MSLSKVSKKKIRGTSVRKMFVTKTDILAGGVTKHVRNKIFLKNCAKIRNVFKKLRQITNATGDGCRYLLQKCENVTTKLGPTGGLPNSGLRSPRRSPRESMAKPLSQELGQQNLTSIQKKGGEHPPECTNGFVKIFPGPLSKQRFSSSASSGYKGRRLVVFKDIGELCELHLVTYQ